MTESQIRRVDRESRARRVAHEAEAKIDALQELRDEVDGLDSYDAVSMQRVVLDLIDETIRDLAPDQADEPS